MTLSYLKEVVDIHTVINGPGYGNSPARIRLDEMRKYPRRQELEARARQRKEKLAKSPSSDCKFCGQFPCPDHK